MAARRYTQDGGGDLEQDERFLGDPNGQGFDLGGTLQQPPGGEAFGWSDTLSPEELTSIQDAQQQGVFDHPIAGNTDPGRSLQRGGETPNRPGPAPMMQQPDSGLPQGVSVNDAMDTPAMPNEPTPISAGASMPMSSQAPSMTGGPRRRSAVNPQIFGESQSPMMHGRAGGLMGGGLGATGGGESSGAIAPTEMMRKLMQMYQTLG